MTTSKVWQRQAAISWPSPELANHSIQVKKRNLYQQQGFSHYDRLTDEQLSDHFHRNVFANFSVSVTADYFLFLR